MKLEITNQGLVSKRHAGTPTAVATEPRCAVTAKGDLVCTYLVSSALGVNDFKAMLSRSCNNGVTWGEEELIWPGLADVYSIEGAVSQAPNGELFFYGTQTPIDKPGESNWCEETQGLKQNELFWAWSRDSGRTWTPPTPIPMPFTGAAEAPGPLCVTQSGRWLGCYAPYNTFDPSLAIDRSQVILVYSDDQGSTWSHCAMLRFSDTQSSAAEAWVVELADGRLLGTCWHINNRDEGDYPNAYAISLDSGESWLPTRSTGIQGQSTALTPLPDGRAFFVYNQRKHGNSGVYVAVASPTETDFGIELDTILWHAGTGGGSSTSHSDFANFSFGEPAVTLLPDGTFLLVLWATEGHVGSIRYITFKLET